MSDFVPNEMTGILLGNERKTTDKHPDSTGTCSIGGVVYRVSAWRGFTKTGKPKLSLKFEEKDAWKNPTNNPPIDDEIVF